MKTDYTRPGPLRGAGPARESPPTLRDIRARTPGIEVGVARVGSGNTRTSVVALAKEVWRSYNTAVI